MLQAVNHECPLQTQSNKLLKCNEPQSLSERTGVPFDLGVGLLTPEIFKRAHLDPQDFS